MATHTQIDRDNGNYDIKAPIMGATCSFFGAGFTLVFAAINATTPLGWFTAGYFLLDEAIIFAHCSSEVIDSLAKRAENSMENNLEPFKIETKKTAIAARGFFAAGAGVLTALAASYLNEDIQIRTPLIEFGVAASAIGTTIGLGMELYHSCCSR